MLGHSTPELASFDITFVNSKSELKVAFKDRANILLLAFIYISTVCLCIHVLLDHLHFCK